MAARDSTVSRLPELIHPCGVCRQTSGLDGIETDRTVTSYDWITLADSGSRLDSRAQLRETLERGLSRLERDGIIWVSPSRRLRPWVRSTVAAAGLEVKGVYVQIADVHGPNTLIPLHLMNSAAVAGLAGRHVRLRQWAAKALSMPGALQLFGAVYPSVGFALGRPGGRSLFNWLRHRTGVPDRAPSIVLRRSWHRRDLVVAYLFGGVPPALSAVAKIALSPETQSMLRSQEEQLRRLAAPAAGWGAETPRPVDPQPAALPTLVTRAIPGEIAAGILERQPSEFRPMIQRLARWLTGWNEATRVMMPREGLLPEMEGIAAALESHIPNGREYLAWLREMLSGAPADIPYVASHGDLTMFNVVSDGGRLGILDWEEARASDLPMGDLFYTMVDALAATHSYRDRTAAFHSCFFGSERQEAVALTKALANRVGLTGPAVEFAFHLCWLRHARNEVNRGGAEPAGPFLRITRQLAARPFTPVFGGLSSAG